MITILRVTNPQGINLDLTFEDPLNGYQVRGITGLDPVKANIISSSFATMDGEQYQSSKREKRNIVVSLGYDPDYLENTVESLRRDLYDFFMTKAEVILDFLNDSLPDVRILGRVETFESPMFVRDPVATLSIMCLDPDFFIVEPVIFEGETVEDTTEEPLNYEGTVDTGVVFQMLLDRDLDEFTIYNRTPNNTVRSLFFSYPLLTGDLITISTVPGSKYATLTRSGVDSSVLYGISPTSNWISLDPGENNIRVAAEGAAIDFTITYTTKIGGL